MSIRQASYYIPDHLLDREMNAGYHAAPINTETSASATVSRRTVAVSRRSYK